MAFIPAFCNNCGLIFDTGIHIEGKVNFFDNVIHCPNCNKKAYISDGLYNATKDSIEILKGPDVSFQRLKTLKRFVSGIQKKQLSNDEIKSEIKKEIPELSSILDVLPKTKKELYTFLGILLALIGHLITYFSTDKTPDITINNVFNNYNNEYVIQRTDSKTQISTKKQGRNEICNCGSQLKYKKCCGKNSK